MRRTAVAPGLLLIVSKSSLSDMEKAVGSMPDEIHHQAFAGILAGVSGLGVKGASTNKFQDYASLPFSCPFHAANADLSGHRAAPGEEAERVDLTGPDG